MIYALISHGMAYKRSHAIMGLRWLPSTYNQGDLTVLAGSDIIITMIKAACDEKMEKAE